ncbi:MAG: aminotransferase class III-fold pyridoxal phosphate-dependent enzyme, partial [Candidatus Eremiobacteraeota bacterium]|nr:aminotransferase class III-fold pyridoxal phosphate-dependent enzyme [Candidatus Eremiobacteraeota bacterium]
VREVRGLGLMLGVELDSADLAKATVEVMVDRGFIINRTNQTVLRFLPPFVIKKKHIDALISALDDVLASSITGTKHPVARRKR